MDVAVGVSVGDGEALGNREGGLNAVEVAVGVRVAVEVGLGTAVRVSASTGVAEAGIDVGVEVPSIPPADCDPPRAVAGQRSGSGASA